MKSTNMVFFSYMYVCVDVVVDFVMGLVRTLEDQIVESL
jgi:hypothetical protein